MKLLIDIPEHIYEHAKESSEDSRDEFDAMRAIANGTQQESRSEIPNTCGDAISRKHLLEEIAMLKKSPWFNENTYGSKVIRKEAVEIVEDVCIKREPSVTPQQRKTQMLDESNFDVNQYEMDLQSAYDCGRASTQQRTGRWIPVSERVPEDGEEVLCFLGSEEMAVLFRRNDWGQDEWVDGRFATDSYDVIAWMPLPEPYKAESEVDS